MRSVLCCLPMTLRSVARVEPQLRETEVHVCVCVCVCACVCVCVCPSCLYFFPLPRCARLQSHPFILLSHGCECAWMGLATARACSALYFFPCLQPAHPADVPFPAPAPAPFMVYSPTLWTHTCCSIDTQQHSGAPTVVCSCMTAMASGVGLCGVTMSCDVC
jgi:hypothetical protein